MIISSPEVDNYILRPNLKATKHTTASSGISSDTPKRPPDNDLVFFRLSGKIEPSIESADATVTLTLTNQSNDTQLMPKEFKFNLFVIALKTATSNRFVEERITFKIDRCMDSSSLISVDSKCDITYHFNLSELFKITDSDSSSTLTFSIFLKAFREDFYYQSNKIKLPVIFAHSDDDSRSPKVGERSQFCPINDDTAKLILYRSSKVCNFFQAC